MTKQLNLGSLIEGLKNKMGYTNEKLASALGVDPRTINNYISDKFSPTSNADKNVFNRILGIIKANDLSLFELFGLDGDNYLFHGSKTGIVGNISIHHNKANNLLDFGNGFYLSESFMTAVTYVDSAPNPHIYRFKKEDIVKQNIKKFKFGTDDIGNRDWVLFIGLCRKKIADPNDQTILNEHFDKLLKDKQLLIGKIADSFNFDVMDAFFINQYDIKQVGTALSMVNIGNQYVIKDEEIANELKYIDDFVLEPKLKSLIITWHREHTLFLKKETQNTVKPEDAKTELKFNAIKKELINNNG